MKTLSIKNKSKNISLSIQTKEASSFLERGIGLMFKKEIDFDGLYIKPCNSIHTFFCRFPLDIFFLNKENEVIRIIRNMKPWRLTRLYFRATSVLEFKTGLMDDKIDKNDQIEVVCLN